MPISVLVTGAAGFIGSHLVERLVADGYTVRAFVHYNSAGNWHNLEKVRAETLEAIEAGIQDQLVSDFVTHTHRDEL